MKRNFLKAVIGHSDHTNDIITSIGAAAAGARCGASSCVAGRARWHGGAVAAPRSGWWYDSKYAGPTTVTRLL